MTPAERWRSQLEAWRIPDELLAAVEDSPYGWPQALWKRRSQAAALDARERVRRGPSRPERVVEGPKGITIISVDPHPEWSDAVTLERSQRFYRLVDCTEIQDDAWTALAYRFRETDERDVIRSLVHYDDEG